MAPIPWTLLRYLFTEMGKTFFLTAVVLTGVLGLGGGVMNMVRIGEVSGGQLIRLLLLTLPVAMALTLPIAALFSAAVTYGRLSADNEFVACRSGGINLHVLFAPAVVLSVVSALVTFAFISFLIPRAVRNLDELVGADVVSWVAGRLERPRGMALAQSDMRLFADATSVDPADPKRLVLDRVTFIESKDNEWVRYGTARQAWLRFAHDDQRLSVTGKMYGLNYYDNRAKRYVSFGEMDIPHNWLPSRVPIELKFLNLTELWHYQRHANEWRKVRDQYDKLRRAATRWAIHDWLWSAWEADGKIELGDAQRRCVLTAKEAKRSPTTGAVELFGVVAVDRSAADQRTFAASRALLLLDHQDDIDNRRIRVELIDAKLTGAAALEGEGGAKVPLGSFILPEELRQRVASIANADLLEQPGGSGSDPLARHRSNVRKARSSTLRQITGIINERFAFSISVCVLVILAAALGIIYRGASVLTAFGISFVPSIFVIVTIVMGKQMAQNAPTASAGLAVMWAGIAVVVGLDLWTLTRVLRR